MYHARDTTYSIVKDQREPSGHTSTRMLFNESKFDIVSCPINAKRAAILVAALSWKIGIFIPRGSGHLARVMINARLRTGEAASKLE
jgi:hypothetical protein